MRPIGPMKLGRDNLGYESVDWAVLVQHVRFGRFNGVLSVIQLVVFFLSKSLVMKSCRVRLGV